MTEPDRQDAPGARLLDVVATMDRLRSPGGCPWDAAQDHETLAPYLLEEAYEAFQAIEDGDPVALREELGDVLLQVVFHARLAEELPAGERWSIDDVATGLVDKLVRRHPHVFADVAVTGADEVSANWDAIKVVERAGRSPLADVPLAAPALTLAATLQRKSDGAGLERAAGCARDRGGRKPGRRCRRGGRALRVRAVGRRRRRAALDRGRVAARCRHRRGNCVARPRPPIPGSRVTGR